jgi:hypothetical protein
MSGIDVSFTSGVILVSALIIAAVAISVLFYRYTLPPVPPARRFLLIALRSAALSLLLLLLFEPLLRLTSTSVRPPVIAILIDNTKSMTIEDRTAKRSSTVLQLLQDDGVRNLTDLANVRYFTFGSLVKSADPFHSDSLTFSEDATDIASALRGIATERQRENIRAVVMLSDGSYNLGQNPLHEAEQLGIPVFTVGIGDSAEQKDVLVRKVITNDRAYGGTSVPVDVTVSSAGFSGERLDVILSEGTRELDRTTVTLGTGSREYAVRLSYTPEGEGTKKLTVRASPLKGELTTANNSKSFFVKVLKSKLRVLLLAGSPGPDVSILKQTLREDKNIEVRSFTQKAGGFYEGTSLQSALDSSDCLMVIGFPTAQTSTEVLERVRIALVQNNMPLFFIASKSIDDTRLRSLGGVLPFIQSNPSQAEQFVFFQPADAQRNHPILVVGPERNPAVWDRMAPIFRTQTVYKAKPEATILGVARLQNIVLNEPLILMRSVGKQRSLAVLGYGLWRWRLMAQGSRETEQVLAGFLSNTIRYLTTQEDTKPVRVSPTKDSYTQGEAVEFTGQVYDASAQPVDNARVRVLLQQTPTAAGQMEREYEMILRPIGNGRYEGSIDGLGGGDYTFRAAAQTDGQHFGEDKGRFVIGEMDLEFQDTRMNAQLLEQLASRSGGEYFTPPAANTLKQEIASRANLTSQQLTSVRTIELWNWQYTLLAIVALLAVEWFIRKRSGML